MNTTSETIATPPDAVRSLPGASRDGNQATLFNDGAVQGASQIHQDPIRAGRIEAYILANMPAEKIASCCGVPLEWVEAYERQHFDVRPRLGDREWIAQHAIGRRHPDRFDDDEVPAFWRLYGYMYPTLLESLLRTFDLQQVVKKGLAIYRNN
jgi:hypothetical protein